MEALRRPPSMAPQSSSLRPPKRLRATPPPLSTLESLPDELLFHILTLAGAAAAKPFSLASRACLAAESRFRHSLRPRRADLLSSLSRRYPGLHRLDFSLCPLVLDSALAAAAGALPRLRSVDLSRSSGFGPAGLAAVAGCGDLEEIDLSNNSGVGDVEIASLADGAKGLRRLRMARCKAVTDVGVGRAAVRCRELEAVGLRWCLGVSDLGVGLLAVKCKKLSSMDLSYTMITKNCLPAIAQLPSLTELSLAGCLAVEDEFLTSLTQCKSVEVLDISNCRHVTLAGVSSAMNGLPNLRELNLAYTCPLLQPAAHGLGSIAKLRSIKLDGCQVSVAALKSIAVACLSLRELSLSKCSGVTDEAVSFFLARHKDLARLDLTCCRNITDASLASIASMCAASLVSLRMESCASVSSTGFQLIGQRCRLLEELVLTDNSLDDEGLKALSGCRNLRTLHIGLCDQISDDGLSHIGRSCSKLEDLDLYRSCGISDKGVAAVSRGCLNLGTINLAYCMNIGDESLVSLSKCPKLHTLEIRGCPHISAAGISSVSLGCRELAKLDIKKCYLIDDAAMLSLSRCSQNLRQINLSYTAVTDLGLLALASISSLENMTVVHLAGITPNGLAAALLLCRGLIKAKLHSSYRTLMLRELVCHVEARGCSVQWVDKKIQVELITTEAWKQQSQSVLV